MSCDPLTAIKASPFYAWFETLPDATIQAWVDWVVASGDAQYLSDNCPKLYCSYVVERTLEMLRQVNASVVNGEVAYSSLDPKVTTFLKKRQVLDTTCEWAVASDCSGCKDLLNSSGYLSTCQNALGGSLGWGYIAGGHRPYCRPCCIGDKEI